MEALDGGALPASPGAQHNACSTMRAPPANVLGLHSSHFCPPSAQPTLLCACTRRTRWCWRVMRSWTWRLSGMFGVRLAHVLSCGWLAGAQHTRRPHARVQAARGAEHHHHHQRSWRQQGAAVSGGCTACRAQSRAFPPHPPAHVAYLAPGTQLGLTPVSGDGRLGGSVSARGGGARRASSLLLRPEALDGGALSERCVADEF